MSNQSTRKSNTPAVDPRYVDPAMYKQLQEILDRLRFLENTVTAMQLTIDEYELRISALENP